jgi:hypothetical protein
MSGLRHAKHKLSSALEHEKVMAENKTSGEERRSFEMSQTHSGDHPTDGYK